MEQEDYREHSGSGADDVDYSGSQFLVLEIKIDFFLERVEGGWGVEDGKGPTMIPEGLA